MLFFKKLHGLTDRFALWFWKKELSKYKVIKVIDFNMFLVEPDGNCEEMIVQTNVKFVFDGPLARWLKIP